MVMCSSRGRTCVGRARTRFGRTARCSTGICCLEPDGRSHFRKLLFRREWDYAFDVLSVNALTYERSRSSRASGGCGESCRRSRVGYSISIISPSAGTISIVQPANAISRGSWQSGPTGRTKRTGAERVGSDQEFELFADSRSSSSTLTGVGTCSGRNCRSLSCDWRRSGFPLTTLLCIVGGVVLLLMLWRVLRRIFPRM
jgi:hypothetical protein